MDTKLLENREAGFTIFDMPAYSLSRFGDMDVALAIHRLLSLKQLKANTASDLQNCE